MPLTLNQLQTKLKKQPKIIIDSIEEEYNFLIKRVNQRERGAKKQFSLVLEPGGLNREGGDATLVNDPLLSAVHFSNYLSVREIIKALFPKKDQQANLKILGVGEGTGLWSYFLASSLKPKQYLATDYQDRLVDYGQKVFTEGSLEFTKLDVIKMDLIQDKSFDVIVACELIEHIFSDNLVAFLKGSKKLLKKGGVVITTTPNRSCRPQAEFSGYPFHFTEFTAQELMDLVKKELPKTFRYCTVLHIANKRVCQEIRKRFPLERVLNSVYRLLLRLFPPNTKREEVINRIINRLYKIKGGMKRKELSLPKEYNQTRLVYQPEDEAQAFGLCLVLQA